MFPFKWIIATLLNRFPRIFLVAFPLQSLCFPYKLFTFLFDLLHVPFMDWASFLPRIADSLVSLLKSGADREPEIIEQV